MPQFDYAEAVLVNGQIAESGPRVIDSFLNALVAQESDVPVGAAPGAGDYTVRVDGEEGIFEFTYTSPGAETQAQVAEGLRAAAVATGDFLNIATFAAPGNDLEIRFIHPDRVYVISFPSNPGNDLSHVLVQAAGGTRIPLAVVVVQGTNDDEARQPTGASVSADALGVLVRNTDSDVNIGDPTVDDGFPPGSTLSAMKQGVMAAQVEDTVAAHGNVFFRIQNPAAGQNLGGLRGDVDGGNAVQLLGAKFKTSTTGTGLAKVQLNMPATA